MLLPWLKVVAAMLLLVGFVWLGLRKPGTPAFGKGGTSPWRLARAFIALGIFAGTCYLPWWLLDPSDNGHLTVMYLSIVWMPVVAIVGGVFAWLWLAMTRDGPGHRTAADVARAKAQGRDDGPRF